MVNLVHSEYLYSADGATQWKAHAMTSGNAEYSKPLRVHISTGYAALLVLLAQGTADVDIDMEVSLNGKDFYTPRDFNGTDLGLVIADGTCVFGTDWWIVLAPQVAEYIRFKFDPDGNSTVTAVYIQQE